LRWLAAKIRDWLDRARTEDVWDAFAKGCRMGEQCFLGPNAWCTNLGDWDDIRLGDRVYVRGLLRCGGRGGKITIGDEVYIGDETIISSESSVSIGSLTLVSHGVHIFDTVGHPLDAAERERDWKVVMGTQPGPRPDVPSASVAIGERVWIGFNATIMRGVSVGDGAVIAAGSIVLEDVEPYTMVAGVPARKIKELPR
jgi:acetyltransferase-like isoleucine patch superfamily enzyme